MHPEYYWYPMLTCLFNFVFGLVTLYMLLDVKKFEDQLGSFQEVAYYFTQDRSLIMLIGIQFGVFCLVFSSHCMFYAVDYISFEIYNATNGLSDGNFFRKVFGEISVAYYIVLVIVALIQYQISFRSNYQNYKNLSYLIGLTLIYSIIMVLMISIYGIYFARWQSDAEYIRRSKQMI